MPARVGILLDRQTLQRGLRGRRTLERVDLYRWVAQQGGLDIILFSVSGLDVRRHRVRGYVPTVKGWRRLHTTIPHVIHKRVLFRTSAPLRTLRRLQRRDVIFVNPLLMNDKTKMYRRLSREPAVRDHLPHTERYLWSRLVQTLDAGVPVILKPTVGSVGQGVLRITPQSGHRVRLTGRQTQVLSRAGLHRRLRRTVGGRRYLLQHYIRLARRRGRPFDLRVPVQRDERGVWAVPGMVAKVAAGHTFLTNMSRGGRALPGEAVLQSAFSPAGASRIISAVERLAIGVADAVSKAHPYAADLGLDIGVDQDGKPWLIEVNARDQRYTFRKAGLYDAFRTMYYNPIAYCARLLKDANQ